VRIEDHGPGIRPENLPATILQPGFSTAVSLGMGYTIMLKLADQVWLATSPAGTAVQVDKLVHPPQSPEDPVAAALDRLGV
jgi:anti-sigma regulatory factor (Ser/Thr protein kinase)